LYNNFRVIRRCVVEDEQLDLRQNRDLRLQMAQQQG
jgi:hypothetical protein